MIRTNLSTRPFYNERAAHALLGIAALLVVGLTIWNTVRIVTLSRQNTELATRTNREHAEADRLTREAAGIRRSIDRDQLQQVANAASEANYLIDQRTFSWTAFFNRIESTLPPDVMLTAVNPTVRDGQTHVLMNVLGRRAVDIDEFMEKLEATGAFYDVLPTREDQTEQGLYRVAIASVYEPQMPEPAAEDPPSGTPPAPDAAPAGTVKPAAAGGQP